MRTVNYVSYIKETVAALKSLENKEENARRRKRLQLLRILKSGLTPYLTEACRMVGYSDKHGREIWRKYLATGLEEAVRINYARQKRGKLTFEQEAEVNREAATGGFGSQAQAQQFIVERFGVSLAISNVGKLFQRMEVKAKVPRPLNRKTSERAQLAYKKTMPRD